MVRRSALSSLSKAPPKFDPVLLSPTPGSRRPYSFESLHSAESEDRNRCVALRKAARLSSRKEDEVALVALADILDVDQRTRCPRTQASSRYMRRRRRRMIAHILSLIDSLGAPPANIFTLIPDWLFSPEELRDLQPKRLVGRLRSWLISLGAAQASGILIAILHGEYDCSSHLFHLHVHGLATNDMIDVVEHTRTLRPLTSPRSVMLQPLVHPVPQISYILKSFWPAKSGPSGHRGRIHRIPEPAHSEYLCWLHKHDFSELVLLMGCRASSGTIFSTE